MTAKIGVAFVIDSLSRGGAERILISLANKLDQSKFRVYVVTTRSKGELAQELDLRVELVCLERRHAIDIEAISQFIKFVQANKIHIVHSHAHSVSYFVEIARNFARSKWVHILHDHYGPIDSSFQLRFFDKLLLRKIDYYIGVSEQLHAYAVKNLRLCQQNCTYLPNGIEIPPYCEHDRAGIFTVVQVGRIMPVKNQLFSIHIAALLSKKISNFRWLFLGRVSKQDQSYAQHCMDEISRYGLERIVQFKGEQTNIEGFLRAAHSGVLTSKFEGLPLALLEYMSWSLPAVVTNVGACSQVLGMCNSGFVVPSNDIEQFVDKLALLHDDKDLATSYGKKNYECVKKNYSIEKMVAEVEEIYGQVVV